LSGRCSRFLTLIVFKVARTMACVTLKRPLDLDPLEALHSPNRPQKRRRCTPLKSVDRESNSLSCQTSSEPSAFRESPLSPSQVANYLRDELKRLRKRRQLAELPSTSRSPPASPGSPEPMMADLDRASPNSLAGPSSPKSVHVMTKTPTKNGERPVFTLKQMTMICEKMCKERTDQVREEYDRILQQKLSEQYDAFVKFVDHQIQQRFNQSQLPSYLS